MDDNKRYEPLSEAELVEIEANPRLLVSVVNNEDVVLPDDIDMRLIATIRALQGENAHLRRSVEYFAEDAHEARAELKAKEG